MNHQDWLNSTARWGTCDHCSTNVVVYRHPEAETDLPEPEGWEGVGTWEMGIDCPVCGEDLMWGGADPVKAVIR